MSALDNVILGPIEAVSSTLGLRTPGMRGFAAAALTTGLLFYFKPKLMFDKIGNQRPWSLMDKKSAGLADLVPPTPLPWYVASAGVGGAILYFV